MTLILAVVVVAAIPMVIWLAVGRNVLRVGYVPITKKPWLETEVNNPAVASTVRHDGVLHLVIADHVDPGLVLIVLRLDGASQWISTARTDAQGFGIARLDCWRTSAQRVAIFEKPRAHEVVVRPIAVRIARSAATDVSSDAGPLGPPTRSTRYVAVRGPLTVPT